MRNIRVQSGSTVHPPPCTLILHVQGQDVADLCCAITHLDLRGLQADVGCHAGAATGGGQGVKHLLAAPAPCCALLQLPSPLLAFLLTCKLAVFHEAVLFPSRSSWCIIYACRLSVESRQTASFCAEAAMGCNLTDIDIMVQMGLRRIVLKPTCKMFASIFLFLGLHVIKQMTSCCWRRW